VAGALGGGVTALLAGEGVEGLAPSLIAHGADEVLVADDPTLKDRLTPLVKRSARNIKILVESEF
jgi:hypothetical protein